jgi:hypothetical protein
MFAAACVVIFCTTIFAEPFTYGESVKWEVFQDANGSPHPWSKSMSLPTTLDDIGLTGMLSFPSTFPVMRDGGSLGIFIRDEKGRFFTLCIPPVCRAGRFDPEAVFPRLTIFIGAEWMNAQTVVRVPYDSPSERFLWELISPLHPMIEKAHCEQLEKARAELTKMIKAVDDYRAKLEQTSRLFEQEATREEERKAAQPGATDNPDDAQRLREDH